MFGKSKPNYEKLISNLRLAIARLKLLEKKKTEIAIKARKEIADYIGNGKFERARIRVESIIREDLTAEAMEIVELYCDLLLTRISLLKSTNTLDPGLEKPIASLLWASPRLSSEVKEFKTISSQLARKYGKVFKQACYSDLFGTVDKSLMNKLNVAPPPKILVEKYMEEIAKTYNVKYTPVYTNVRKSTAGRRNNNGGTVNSNTGGGGIAMMVEDNLTKSSKRLSLPVESVPYFPSRQLSEPGSLQKLSPGSCLNLPNVPDASFKSSHNKNNKKDRGPVIGFEQLEIRLRELRTTPTH